MGLGVAGLSSRTTVYCLERSGRLRLGEGTSSWPCCVPDFRVCSRSRAKMRSWATTRTKLSNGIDGDMSKRAHLEVLRTVSPSFWLHRLCKLEDIQPSAFLSARTTSGFDNWIFFFPRPLFSMPGTYKTTILKSLPRASRGSSFRFRLIRRIV